MLRIFGKDIFPHTGNRSIHHITRHVFMAVLDRIVLRMAELPPLLSKLRTYHGDQQTLLGIWLLLLTGARNR